VFIIDGYFVRIMVASQSFMRHRQKHQRCRLMCYCVTVVRLSLVYTRNTVEWN